MFTHPLFLYLIVALAILNPRIARSAEIGESLQTAVPFLSLSVLSNGKS